MPKVGKTIEVRRTEAVLYLAKAEQFLEEARTAITATRHDAAMLNAIHAALAAADAASIALAGRRSADPDHQRATDLLEEVASGSETAAGRARQLRLLLAKKNEVEYAGRRATAGEAAQGVKRATAMVAWSRGVVARARL